MSLTATADLAEPMPSGLTSVYRGFFGLKERPFSITPDPEYLYLGGSHRAALAQLKLSVEERAGFSVLTGEVGCGKTTICRQFFADLDKRRYDTALILTPRQTETQLLRSILIDLGEEKPARTSAELVAQIHQLLLQRVELGKDVVIIIDEAQHLEPEVLEQVRLLSNLETNKQKLLQIVLVGQPELMAILARRDMRQLRQRILFRAEIRPLSYREIVEYIHHRLHCAGGNGRVRFSSLACRAIHYFSGGVPRIVNQLCDKSMLAAFNRTSTEVGFSDAWAAKREVTWP